MYKLEPSITRLYWLGESFEGIDEYGHRLIAEANSENCTSSVAVKGVKNILSSGVLEQYIENGNKPNREEYLRLVANNVKFLEVRILPEKYLALRLGYALTGQKFFMIGHGIFSSIADFAAKTNELYRKDRKAYIKYFLDNEQEIEDQAGLFNEAERAEFNKYVLDRSRVIILGDNEYCFKNWQDFESYTDKLWDMEPIPALPYFAKKCGKAIDNITANLSSNDMRILEGYQQRVKAMFCFDEYYFKDVASFLRYAANLKQENEPAYELFLRLHRESLRTASWEQSKEAQLLLKELWSTTIEENCAEQQGSEEKINFDTETIVPGTILKLGSYFYKNAQTKQPIDWLVLEVDYQNDKALLISSQALDCQPYHDHFKNISWEQCSLRKWLNSYFIREAFDLELQERICKTATLGSQDPDKLDKIFVLNIEEATNYFSDEESRRCQVTPYAEARGVQANRSYSSYWLLSPGHLANRASIVCTDGAVGNYGLNVDSENLAVRPAFWINL